MAQGFGGVEIAPGRRLPIFLLIDRSGSMGGPPIEGVKQGLQLFQQAIAADPVARSTAWVSVISFGGDVQATPLVKADAFQAPSIQASADTPLGQALDRLNALIDSEVKRNAPEQKGDAKPLVFLMTDGAPTDDWQSALARLKGRKERQVTVVAIGCGPAADVGMLKQVTNQVFRLDVMTTEAFVALFKWISQSAKTASQQVSSGAGVPAAGATVPMAPNFLKFAT